MPLTTRLCLVRHGETDWNAEQRIQGHRDQPLNPVGLNQAEAAGTYFAGYPPTYSIAATCNGHDRLPPLSLPHCASRLFLTPICANGISAVAKD